MALKELGDETGVQAGSAPAGWPEWPTSPRAQRPFISDFPWAAWDPDPLSLGQVKPTLLKDEKFTMRDHRSDFLLPFEVLNHLGLEPVVSLSGKTVGWAGRGSRRSSLWGRDNCSPRRSRSNVQSASHPNPGGVGFITSCFPGCLSS